MMRFRIARMRRFAASGLASALLLNGACSRPARSPSTRIPVERTESSGSPARSAQQGSVITVHDTGGVAFRGLQMAASSASPPGEFSGIIIDAQSRTPIDVAMVSVPSMNASAVTNEQGRFRLKLPPGGPYEVSVRRLGYQPRRYSLAMSADAGQVALITLDRSKSHFCDGVYGEDYVRQRDRAPALRIRIRSVHAFTTPRPANLSIAAYSDLDDSLSTVVRADLSKETVVELGNSWRFGDYRVTIQGEEIREWRWAGEKDCWMITLELDAWVFPR